MGEINVNNFKEKKINLVARQEIVSRRGIQIASPLTGKKKILDFGTDLKNLNLTIYTNDLNNFQEGQFLKLFSDQFVGDIKVENLNISEYSSLPYSMVTLSALGEDSFNFEKTSVGENIIPITGLEKFFNITYSTTHIENIGTSVSISYSSKYDEHFPTIEFEVGNKKVNWGNTSFRLVGVGKNLSRITSSHTYSFSDPLNLILQKTVIVSNISEKNSQFMRLLKDSNKVTYLPKEKLQDLLINTISKGHITEFISRILNEPSIRLNGEREDKSPIVKILKSSPSAASGSFTNMFYRNIGEQLMRGGIFTVGSILAQILPIFGLEIYYNRDYYSIEPPRFLFKDKSTTSPIEIHEDDIINITVESPKVNIPSIILPRIDFQNMAISSYATKCSEMFAAQIMQELSKIKNLPVFKIKTYDIPNILVPQGFQYNTQSLFERVNKNFMELWKYYSAFAFKSTFNEMNIGNIELVFSPHILDPFKWYKIGDKEYFVTTITHSISRGTATTSLQFSGIYDETLYSTLDRVINKVSQAAKHNCGKMLKDTLNKHNLKTPLNTKKKNPEKIDLKKKVKP